MVFYVNPYNWIQVIVSAERQDEWSGIASILYRKAPVYDWDALKRGSEKVIKPEDRQKVLRATHEWAFDRMTAYKENLPAQAVMALFTIAKDEVRDYALEGVSALVVGSGGAIQSPITLVAIEKNSPAYADIADLREVFNYAEKFFIASTLDQAIVEALDYLGIYEC